MKKILLLSGLGLAGVGLYAYFKKQVDLAMNYDYKITYVHLDKIEGGKAYVTVEMAIKNKSNFEITISEYLIDIFFKGTPFANTKSAVQMKIMPNAIFSFRTQGAIDLEAAKVNLFPFLSDILNRKPIDFEVSGFVRIVFLHIPSTIKFNREKVNYTVDLLKDYNLDTDYEKLKSKFPKLFAFLKINK